MGERALPRPGCRAPGEAQELGPDAAVPLAEVPGHGGVQRGIGPHPLPVGLGHEEGIAGMEVAHEAPGELPSVPAPPVGLAVLDADEVGEVPAGGAAVLDAGHVVEVAREGVENVLQVDVFGDHVPDGQGVQRPWRRVVSRADPQPPGGAHGLAADQVADRPQHEEGVVLLDVVHQGAVEAGHGLGGRQQGRHEVQQLACRAREGLGGGGQGLLQLGIGLRHRCLHGAWRPVA